MDSISSSVNCMRLRLIRVSAFDAGHSSRGVACEQLPNNGLSDVVHGFMCLTMVDWDMPTYYVTRYLRADASLSGATHREQRHIGAKCKKEHNGPAHFNIAQRDMVRTKRNIYPKMSLVMQQITVPYAHKWYHHVVIHELHNIPLYH